MFRRPAPLVVAAVLFGCGDPESTLPFDDAEEAAALRTLLLEAGLEPLPATPTVSDSMFVLGRALAFDPVLSGDRDIACLTCHHPVLGTDDDRALSAGVGADGLGVDRTSEPIIPRSAPPLFNLHTYDTMFWDSRVEPTADGGAVTPAGAQMTRDMVDTWDFGLASAQAMFPVTSRHEMRGEEGHNELANVADDDFTGMWSGLMTRLGNIPLYVDLFEAAYPGQAYEDLTFAHAGNALAGFEVRAFSTPNTPLDRFLAGDDTALTEDQRAGARAFLDAGCASCHTGPALSDFATHNVCLPHVGPGKGHGEEGDQDYGRGALDSDADLFAFRTAPLRNVTLTAPYGHAGQFPDLHTYVAHYADPDGALVTYDPEVQLDDPALWELHDPTINDDIMAAMDPAIDGMQFDVDAVVAFLGALEDPDSTDLAWTVPETVPSGLDVLGVPPEDAL